MSVSSIRQCGLCGLTRHHPSPWLDSLLLPVYVAAVSGVTLCLQSFVDALHKKGLSEDVPISAGSNIPRGRFLQKSVENLGGGTIFAYKLVQLLVILGLLGISLAELILQNWDNASRDLLGTAQVVLIAQCAVYVSYDHDSLRAAEADRRCRPTSRSLARWRCSADPR